MDTQTVKKLNKEVTCRRISASLGYGSYHLIREKIRQAGIKNQSKWIEDVLTREALKLDQDHRQSS